MTSPLSNNLVSPATASITQDLPRRQEADRALAQPSGREQPVAEPTLENLVGPVQRVNETLRPYGVEFVLSEESSRIIVRIVDIQTGELIRQIPAEEALRAAIQLPEFKGLLFSSEE